MQELPAAVRLHLGDTFSNRTNHNSRKLIGDYEESPLHAWHYNEHDIVVRNLKVIVTSFLNA